MVLTLTMSKVQAWERLNNPEHCGRLTMGEYHELMLEAGYSEEVAARAACRRGYERLSAGVTM